MSPHPQQLLLCRMRSWSTWVEFRRNSRQSFQLLCRAVPEHKGTSKSLWNDLLRGCLSVVKPPKRKRWSEEMGVKECHDRPTGQRPWVSLQSNKNTPKITPGTAKSCCSFLPCSSGICRMLQWHKDNFNSFMEEPKGGMWDFRRLFKICLLYPAATVIYGSVCCIWII